MLYIIVIMLKRASGIVGRVYVDAFYLPGIERQQGFEGLTVVAQDCYRPGL
ncbi:MAG: hypothetical protein LBF83_03535 [Spirochaetaceae bacterium]|jgi:hypothetical protein|nr:hypothetical protein [Spirochaetaceae bacterium]